MSNNDIVVLDDDDSSDSDVEMIAPSLSNNAHHHTADDVVVDMISSAAARKRRRKSTQNEVEFIGSKAAVRRRSASSAVASVSNNNDAVRYMGTKKTTKNHRASFPNYANNLNNGINNAGGFTNILNRSVGGGSVYPFNLRNMQVLGGMDSSLSRYRYGPSPPKRDSSVKNKAATKRKEPEATAMEKGKAMQQPHGFDAIDMYYPRLKANDRTLILHTLLLKCTNSGYSKKLAHDFRVKFEKSNSQSTLWSLAKAFSEEICVLEGDSNMPAKMKLKSDVNGNQCKENRPGANIEDDADESDKKPAAPIGSLSSTVLDTLTTYFRAYHDRKWHKAMLDAIKPTESESQGSLTCCICSDDFDAGDTVACSGEDIHFFCKPCLLSYCTVTLESGRLESIKCPLPNCKSLFATQDIKAVLSKYDILKIEHREDSRDRRVALAAKAILHCECGVVAIVTDEDLGDGRVVCPGSQCGKRTIVPNVATTTMAKKAAHHLPRLSNGLINTPRSALIVRTVLKKMEGAIIW